MRNHAFDVPRLGDIRDDEAGISATHLDFTGERTQFILTPGRHH